MDFKTLEQYFLEDYERLKAENEDMRAKLQELQRGEFEFGVTDLHRKFRAVRGGVCNSWTIRTCLLNDGKVTPERIREVMALEDAELFEKFKNRTLSYYSVISYEEHEFQYTLHVKESRDEWTAVTDGKKGDELIEIPTRRELGEELILDQWYPIEEAQAVQDMLAQALRENMEEALEKYEREQADKEDGDGRTE